MERLVYARALDAAAATGTDQALAGRGPGRSARLSRARRAVDRERLAGSACQAQTRRARRLQTRRARHTGPRRRPTAHGNRSRAPLLDVLAGPPPQVPTVRALGEHAIPHRHRGGRARAAARHPGAAGRAHAGRCARSDRECANPAGRRGDGADLTAVRATIVRLADHLGPADSAERGAGGSDRRFAPGAQRSRPRAGAVRTPRPAHGFSMRGAWRTSAPRCSATCCARSSTRARSATPKARPSSRATSPACTSSVSTSPTRHAGASAHGNCRSTWAREDSRGTCRARCWRWISR